ncbi:MAG: hypothetical protein II157_05490 [Bacteroidales bacterium]|nr:hypothetical protein [Bacteroidales bacterium]
MKKFRLASYLLAAALLVVPFQSSAQGRFGKDSAECVNNLNFYQDYLRQGNMDEAYVNWTQAMKFCPPKVSQNMYINGRKIMLHRINKYNGDAAGREALIDSLLTLAETRASLFPKNAKKAKEGRLSDIMVFYGQNPEKTKYIYDNLDAYATEFGAEADHEMVVNAMIKATELYAEKKLTDEDIMNLYSKYNDIFEAKRAAMPEDTTIDAAEAMLQNAFINSGVATCENLVKVFAPRFEQNKEDMASLKVMSSLLNSNECTDTELFSEVVAQMYKLDPSAGTAYYLYRFFNTKGDKETALKYLKEAANVAEGVDKGTYMYELATIYYSNRQFGQAVSTARQASELNPKYAGKAEMLIGTIWAATSCGGDEIAKRAKFWVAVDCMQRAKAKDPSLADEANKNIARYSSYFPKAEDAFMYDIVNGQGYTVSCGGMSASTVVRTIK